MKTLRYLLLSVMVITLAGQSVTSVDSASNNHVLSGTNADFGSVYTEGDEVYNMTSEASENDRDTFKAFPDKEDGQYLYLGMETVFDQISFDIEGTARAYDNQEDPEFTWQYFDGNSWEDLDLDKDTTDNFSKISSGLVSFEIPSDWEMTDYEGEDAYWVRIRLDNELKDSPIFGQISARAYNLKVTVQNDAGENFVSLSKDNFILANGSDNKIYGFVNLGSGDYLLATQSEDFDVTYTLVVMVDSYLDSGMALDVMGNDLMEVSYSLSYNRGCDTPYTDIDYHWSQSAIRELYCRGVVEEWDADTFGLNRTVTRAEFLKMALLNSDVDTKRYKGREVPFDDVDEDEWYAEYVSAAYQLAYIDGDDQYNPDDRIERSEAVTLLIRMAGVESNTSVTIYKDVERSDWFASAIRSATDYGVVEGYTDLTFKPGNDISRAEAAVMINNAFYAWYDKK